MGRIYDDFLVQTGKLVKVIPSPCVSQVEKGETITITKRGKPIAVLSPAQAVADQDVSAVIAQFRAFSKEHARTHGSL